MCPRRSRRQLNIRRQIPDSSSSCSTCSYCPNRQAVEAQSQSQYAHQNIPAIAARTQLSHALLYRFNGSLRDFRLLLRRGRKRLQLDSAFVLVGHRHDDDCWIRRHVPSNWTWQTRRFPLRNLRRSLHRTTRSLHRLEFPQTLSGGSNHESARRLHVSEQGRRDQMQAKKKVPERSLSYSFSTKLKSCCAASYPVYLLL